MYRHIESSAGFDPSMYWKNVADLSCFLSNFDSIDETVKIIQKMINKINRQAESILTNETIATSIIRMDVKILLIMMRLIRTI